MFKGGLKLLDFKELSKKHHIEDFPSPKQAVIPLSQHTGIPAKPCVKKGDAVLKGQLIGESGGFISCNVHSSISGTVSRIENRALPTGKSSLSIIIENDEQDSPSAPIENNWKEISPEQITEIVRQAGIVGMGGAAFPSSVKLSLPKGKKADCVILNGCECEPFLTSDYKVMQENPSEILEGLQIICKALCVNKAYIGLESNKKDIAAEFKKIIANSNSHVKTEIKVLPEKYPQGSEKHLIKSVTGKEVPSGALPIDTGCVVFNAQTAFSIKEAVCEGKPLIERVLTITGLVKTPKNIRARIGTPLSHIIQYCGGELSESQKLIVGGPMMGVQIPSAEVPVIKNTTGIIILPAETPVKNIRPCIRCGKCIEVCPMRLVPAELSRYAESERWGNCRELDVADCIECGCCSYICPAKRPLVELFKWAKVEMRKQDE